jgi:hypothetical protein
MLATKASSSLRDFLRTEPRLSPEDEHKMAQVLLVLGKYGLTGL